MSRTTTRRKNRNKNNDKIDDYTPGDHIYCPLPPNTPTKVPSDDAENDLEAALQLVDINVNVTSKTGKSITSLSTVSGLEPQFVRLENVFNELNDKVEDRFGNIKEVLYSAGVLAHRVKEDVALALKADEEASEKLNVERCDDDYEFLRVVRENGLGNYKYLPAFKIKEDTWKILMHFGDDLGQSIDIIKKELELKEVVLGILGKYTETLEMAQDVVHANNKLIKSQRKGARKIMNSHAEEVKELELELKEKEDKIKELEEDIIGFEVKEKDNYDLKDRYYKKNELNKIEKDLNNGKKILTIETEMKLFNENNN